MTTPDPTDALTITPCDPADEAALCCLRAYYAELDATFDGGFDPGPVPGSGLDEMRPPRGCFLLARQGETVLGCVALRGEPDGWGEVKRLWVAPDARGLRLASRLMAAVEDQARALGMTRLHLDTSRFLPRAIAMYRGKGWAEVGRYNDNPYADFFFEKRL